MTHLTTAIAYQAIQDGFDAFFASAAALIDDLSCASREGRFAETLKTYVRPAVLVVDELGSLSCRPDAANVLFHVVNARCLQRRALLFTTNKPLKDWGAALHDYDLAAAILDRVLERGRIVVLERPSMRTRHLQGIDDERCTPEPCPRRICWHRPAVPSLTGSGRAVAKSRSPTCWCPGTSCSAGPTSRVRQPSGPCAPKHHASQIPFRSCNSQPATIFGTHTATLAIPSSTPRTPPSFRLAKAESQVVTFAGRERSTTHERSRNIP